MKVLSVASEAHPLVKTGGLGDVVGALPDALGVHGVEVNTLLPGYPTVLSGMRSKKRVHDYQTLFGSKAAILQGEAAGLSLFVLDAPLLFDRPGGPYGSNGEWSDNWRRYAALGKAGADVAMGIVPGWKPDVVHAHDWQAAMMPAYLRYAGAGGTPSVVTIHNLAFQGQFPASIFPELGLPPEAMALDGVEYYGGVGFLKAGLQAAHAITTVSPTYAQEIRTPAFGMGLDGLLNLRSGNVHGILNGIDVATWNPQADPHLAATYSVRTLAARKLNRGAIEERFGLERDPSPLVTVISRLTWQKGMDILAHEFDRLVSTGIAVEGIEDRLDEVLRIVRLLENRHLLAQAGCARPLVRIGGRGNG